MNVFDGLVIIGVIAACAIVLSVQINEARSQILAALSAKPGEGEKK